MKKLLLLTTVAMLAAVPAKADTFNFTVSDGHGTGPFGTIATSLNADGVKALATLPSLNELRARLVGMIATPATRIAQIVNAPAASVARVIGAYARKDEAA